MSEKYEEKRDGIKNLDDIHARALREFTLTYESAQDERSQCLEDRRFASIPGAQWEGDQGALFENKPKLEINKGQSSLVKIFNEYRANRVTVDYISKDGSDREELADTCDRMYRADEMKSTATEAYDNCFDEATSGGFGAWRYRADLEDEYDLDNEYQSICIEPIYDADSCVFFDSNAMRQDKSDAMKCWVLIPFTKDSFEEEFDGAAVTWPKETDQTEFDWFGDDKIYIAEYYEVEKTTEEISVFENEEGEREVYTVKEIEEDPAISEDLAIKMFKLKEKKKIKKKRVHKYLMSGAEILEDCGYIAGTEIPITPMYGKRWVIDGIERMMGHIRLYKDVQRVFNALYSKLLEIAALSSVEKPIFTADQINEFWEEWANDNINNYPALRVNTLKDKDGNDINAGPVGYTKVPNIPPALGALFELIVRDMGDILGNDQEGQKMISNISGEAIERIQNRLDMQSFIYMSNFAKAMRRGGQIWLSMARDLYTDKGRKMMALGKENSVDYIELKKPFKDEESGNIIFKNDFKDANFEIMVDVGPSYTSKKAKIVRELTEVLQMTPAVQDPETATILLSMIMYNMEGEGIQGIREYYRQKLVKLGVEQPTEEEKKRIAEEAQNQPPNANEEYLLAAARKEDSEAAENIANREKIQAQAAESLAKTIKIIEEVRQTNPENAMELVQKLNQSLGSGNQPAVPAGNPDFTVEQQNIQPQSVAG